MVKKSMEQLGDRLAKTLSHSHNDYGDFDEYEEEKVLEEPGKSPDKRFQT